MSGLTLLKTLDLGANYKSLKGEKCGKKALE